MKRAPLLLAILVSLLISSCSWLGLSKKGDEPVAQASSEAEVDLFSDAEFADNSDVAKPTEKAIEQKVDEKVEELAALEEEKPVEPVQKVEVREEPIAMAMTGEMASYSVKKGDTLMLMAFNLYGDYRMWHKIAKANKNLKMGAALIAGTTIVYPKPEKEFNWMPDGTPYMILMGDTLGKISNKVYGTPREWKYIWENNKPLIQDPNKIYAGFTLYYKEKTRDLASQKL